jgi:hypothetical protein
LLTFAGQPASRPNGVRYGAEYDTPRTDKELLLS